MLQCARARACRRGRTGDCPGRHDYDNDNEGVSLVFDALPGWPHAPLAPAPIIPDRRRYRVLAHHRSHPVNHGAALMSVEEIKTRLRAELPVLLQQDARFRHWLEELIRTNAVTPRTLQRID